MTWSFEGQPGHSFCARAPVPQNVLYSLEEWAG